MIVTKTPLRIPLAGGLTDLKPYVERFGGTTVSATVDKYVYITLKHSIDDHFNLRYHDVHERTRHVDGIHHDLAREAIRLMGLEDDPLEISIQVELAGESGLGSSGSMTVGLLHAMAVHRGDPVDAGRLLLDAARIEVDILEGASGYHDPAICALGGLKRIDYRMHDGSVAVTGRDVALDAATRTAFAGSLLFFYSGRHARTKPSLDLLSSRFDEAIPVLHDIRTVADTLETALVAGDVPTAGAAIGEMQELKQRLPGHFVDDYVADLTNRVRAAGGHAQIPGGKISAFAIVCAPPDAHAAVRAALCDLREVNFRLETVGTQSTVI